MIRALHFHGRSPGSGNYPASCVAAKNKTKPEIEAAQLYSMAREWRSGNLVHRSTHLNVRRDVLLRSKDSWRRSEINDGKEAGFSWK